MLFSVKHAVAVGVGDRHYCLQKWPVALFERGFCLQQPVRERLLVLVEGDLPVVVGVGH